MKQLLIRLVSSEDHDLSLNELLALIKKKGTDRYDKNRKHIFHDFYGKHKVDFFAEKDVNEDNLEQKIDEMVRLFPERTRGDRKKAVIPEIVIVYDASKCRMIKNVYCHGPNSDCFQFLGDPKEALVEVRKIK